MCVYGLVCFLFLVFRFCFLGCPHTRTLAHSCTHHLSSAPCCRAPHTHTHTTSLNNSHRDNFPPASLFSSLLTLPLPPLLAHTHRRTIETRPTKALRKWRELGTAIVQFEFFLHFTKSIVPMLMLIVLGATHSGLLTSFFTGWVCGRLSLSLSLCVCVCVWILGWGGRCVCAFM